MRRYYGGNMGGGMKNMQVVEADKPRKKRQKAWPKWSKSK